MRQDGERNESIVTHFESDTVPGASEGERMDGTIASVERTRHWVPMVGRVRVEMERAGIHTWSEVEVIRVTSASGITGWGETIQNYTWGRADIDERVVGRSPFDLYWDDSLGAGLQMAVLDLAGKLAGVPAHRLLGEQVRSHCPVSFWDHDMAPERYEAEAREAVRLGYTCMKIKTRPWWDVHETIARISEATPPWFAIDADWNDFLLDAPTALPVLSALEREFPKIKIYEGPIPSDDIDGNRRLRAGLRTPIAHHYDEARQGVARAEYCDGYVIGGGIAATIRAGHFAGSARMPFFLQMVGTGLTASLCLQLGAVLASARWPAVTVHELYEHNLLSARIPVSGGYMAVPDAPGLGVEVDQAALDRYRVDKARPGAAAAGDPLPAAVGAHGSLRSAGAARIVDVELLRRRQPARVRGRGGHRVDRRRRQRRVRPPVRADPGQPGGRQRPVGGQAAPGSQGGPGGPRVLAPETVLCQKRA